MCWSEKIWVGEPKWEAADETICRNAKTAYKEGTNPESWVLGNVILLYKKDNHILLKRQHLIIL